MKKFYILILLVFGIKLIFSQSILLKQSSNDNPSAVSLVVSPLYLAFGNVQIGEFSDEKTITVNGSNLNEVITLSSTDGYLLSLTSGSNYQDTLFLQPISGEIDVVIYAIFNPNLTELYNGFAKFESVDINTKVVPLFGTGVDELSPILNLNQLFLSFGDVQINTESEVSSYLLSGTNLVSDVTVSSPTGFLISLTSDGIYSDTIIISPSNGIISNEIFVIFNPELVTVYSGNIKNESDGVIKNLAVIGNGIDAFAPTITFSPTFLNFGNIMIAQTSEPQIYSFYAQNLTENIEIESPESFQISSDGVNYYQNLTIENDNGFAEATIFVTFSPSAIQLYTSSIIHSSNNLSNSITVTGFGSSNEQFSKTFIVTDNYGNLAQEAEIIMNETTLFTNEHGVAVFENLYVGMYDYVVNYTNHLPYSGIAFVLNQNDTIEVFLNMADLNSFQNDNSQFSIFPNPTTGVFYIKNNYSFSKEFLLNIYDVSGKLLLSNQITENNNFDITSFKKGLYFVKIFNENENHNFKIIKN